MWKGSCDEGEVVKKERGDEGKWCRREGSDDKTGLWQRKWRREVVTKGSGNKGKWSRRELMVAFFLCRIAKVASNVFGWGAAADDERYLVCAAVAGGVGLPLFCRIVTVPSNGVECACVCKVIGWVEAWCCEYYWLCSPRNRSLMRRRGMQCKPGHLQRQDKKCFLLTSYNNPLPLYLWQISCKSHYESRIKCFALIFFLIPSWNTAEVLPSVPKVSELVLVCWKRHEVAWHCGLHEIWRQAYQLFGFAFV